MIYVLRYLVDYQNKICIVIKERHLGIIEMANGMNIVFAMIESKNVLCILFYFCLNILWWLPLLLLGSYPAAENETTIMTACIVSDDSDCWYSWNVTAMRCQSFNLVYLEPIEHCGRFCMGWYHL